MITLRHVGLIVDDIETSLKLYRDILGFVPEVDQVEHGEFFEHLTGIATGQARTCKCYAEDGSCIELIEFYSHDNTKRNKELLSQGFNHIALNVQELDSLYKDLLEFGLDFVGEPKLNDHKTAKVCFCKDKEGNLLELVELF